MRQRAVIYLLISVVLWSTSGVLVKESSLDALALVGGRSLFAGAVLLLYLRHPRWTWSTAQIGGAIAYVLMQILFVRATQMTSAANAILLQYTSPIWIAIFGYWFLGEKPIAIDYVTMALIGGGMFLFFGDELTPAGMVGNMLAILSGIAMAWFMLFLRKQKDESPLETVLLGNGIGVVIGLPFLILAAPSARDWSIVVVLGIFQLGLPFIFYSKAIKYLGAVEMILLASLEPILNPIWVFLINGEMPGPMAMLGGAIVLFAVLLRAFVGGGALRLTRRLRRGRRSLPAN